VNASAIDFDARSIERITANVTVADEDEAVPVPRLTLVPRRRADEPQCGSLERAVSRVSAILVFRVVCRSAADRLLTMEHEFIDNPIALLTDGDIPEDVRA